MDFLSVLNQKKHLGIQKRHRQTLRCIQMTIGFLPLDSRPCTYDFPVQLAQQAGAQVIVPPAGYISEYKSPSDTSRNLKWLKEIAPKCDCLIISAEQLIHGGLIQSRNARLTTDEQRKVLAELEEIKKQTPKRSHKAGEGKRRRYF